MFLKIEYEGKEKFVDFSQDKLIFGRGSQADIIIRAEGVSRLHLEIMKREDDFFVQDLGSTNGTFINDVRLEPNKPTEFHSFFPINMGGDVIISLSDQGDQGDNEETDPHHKPVSSIDRTGEIKIPKLEKVKPQKKKKDWSWLKGLGPSIFMISSFIVLSIFYVWWKGEEESVTNQNIVTNADTNNQAPEKEKDLSIISLANVLSVIKTIDLNLKCRTPWVGKICKEFSSLRLVGSEEGMMLVKDALFVFINSQKVQNFIVKTYPLDLQDKNILVNRFEEIYPKGDIEAYQIKHQFQLYTPSDELWKKATLIFDFLRLKNTQEIINKDQLKSIVFIDAPKDEQLGYSKINPYFIYLKKDEIEKLLKDPAVTMKAIRFAVMTNDPIYFEQIMPDYVKDIKDLKTPIVFE